jgi:hypothetical protein
VLADLLLLLLLLLPSLLSAMLRAGTVEFDPELGVPVIMYTGGSLKISYDTY